MPKNPLTLLVHPVYPMSIRSYSIAQYWVSVDRIARENSSGRIGISKCNGINALTLKASSGVIYNQFYRLSVCSTEILSTSNRFLKHI
jgi:hypothetical protein